MAHRNIQIPSLKSPPEKRENERNLFLEHDGALSLYHTLGLGGAALPIVRLYPERSEYCPGDATLAENGNSLRNVGMHAIAEPWPPLEKGVAVVCFPPRHPCSGDILEAVPTEKVLGHVQPHFACPTDMLDVWYVIWRAQLHLEDLQK